MTVAQQEELTIGEFDTVVRLTLYGIDDNLLDAKWRDTIKEYIDGGFVYIEVTGDIITGKNVIAVTGKIIMIVSMLSEMLKTTSENDAISILMDINDTQDSLTEHEIPDSEMKKRFTS